MAAYVVCLATLVSTAHAVAVCADTNVANQLQTSSIPGTPLSLPGLDIVLLDWKSPPNVALHPPSLDSLAPSNHQWSSWHQTVADQTAQEQHVEVRYPCASGHYQDLMILMKSIFTTAAPVNCDINRLMKTEPDPPRHRDNRIIDRFKNENRETPSKHWSNSFTNHFAMHAY